VKVAWAQLAKAELAEIKRFSMERWGRDVAIRYVTGLRAAVMASAAEPHGLRKARGPYRIRRAQSHLLIFHLDVEADLLTVARILHARMDIERHLPPLADDEG
jgi:toxin ParE1/3/4